MKKFKNDHLYYIPLGGVGIFGANCYLYRYQNKWIMIDCGLAFNKDFIKYPGIEIMYPDVSFISELKDDLLAIVCTHGHEDHIGAITSLWSSLECPIYGSEFTIKMLEKKLSYDNKKLKITLNVVKPYDNLQLGEFNLDFMPVIHSIPGSMSIKITAGDKVVIHAGDWRLDNDPIIEFSDEKQWKIAGNAGVDAFLCDSTDFGEFEEGQEKELVKPLYNIFSRTKGCAYITIFASNIARIKIIIKAAQKAGRYVGLVGSSLVNNSKIADSCGLLNYNFLTNDDMASIPKEEMVIILTGSQGQNNSALVKLVDDRLNFVDIDENDSVIFSSRAIPGNEKDINKVISKLSSYGAEIITSKDDFVHVSGHSSPKNIETLYKWLKPKTLIAMHGESEQLNANVNLAKKVGIKNALIVNNGDIYDFTDENIIDTIETGLVCKNHGNVISMNSSALIEKKRLIFNGACIVSVAIDDKNRLLKSPKVSLIGLDENKEEAQNKISKYLKEEILKENSIDEMIIKRIVKKKLKKLFDTDKPIIDIHIL